MIRKLLKWFYIIVILFSTPTAFFAWISNFVFKYPEWSILKSEFITKVCITFQNVSLFQFFQKYEIVSVDMSSITTFLILLTFGIPLNRLIFQNHLKNMENYDSFRLHLPYWKGYKNLFVQLGLLGTLFGLIIAFKENEQEIISGNIEEVLSALSTALWSTFSAVILAFVVCPYFIVKPFKTAFKSFFEASTDPEKDTIVELEKSFNELKNKVVEAKEDVNEFNNRIEEFDLSNVTTSFESLTKEISEVTKSIQDANKEISNMKEINEIFKEISKINKGISGLREDINNVRIITENNSERIKAIEDNAKDLSNIKNFFNKLKNAI